MAYGSSNSYSLCTSQFKHTLHIDSAKRGLDSHLGRMELFCEHGDALMYSVQFFIYILAFSHVDYTHGHDFRLAFSAIQNAISHEVGTRVNAEYDVSVHENQGVC